MNLSPTYLKLPEDVMQEAGQGGEILYWKACEKLDLANSTKSD